MSDRFDGLKKLPKEPAAKILAAQGVTLDADPGLPAATPVAEVLRALDAQGAHLDMLALLAHGLPMREATWWACLAAREMGGDTAAIRASEAWVRQPGFETRSAARTALDTARNDDDTALCAMAASFADGTLGPGEYDDYPAPPGAVGAAVRGMVLTALFADEDAVQTRLPRLLAQALDIARGGNGQAEPNPSGPAHTE